MKDFVKKIIRKTGFEIRRFSKVSPPIGEVRDFLAQVKERGFHPEGIIDVGANKGSWTMMARSVFPKAKFLMIEPQEEMAGPLSELCRVHEGIDFVQAGAGKESGQLVQTIWNNLEGSSFVPDVDEAKVQQGKQRLTPVVSIDELLLDRKDFCPDLVKMDIQGFEIEALKGAESLFGRTELFILETSLYEFMQSMPLAKDCISFMSSKGYEIYDIAEYFRRPLDGALGQIDFAFAKREGVLRKSNDWTE